MKKVALQTIRTSNTVIEGFIYVDIRIVLIFKKKQIKRFLTVFQIKNMKWTRLIFGRGINCGTVIYKGNPFKG